MPKRKRDGSVVSISSSLEEDGPQETEPKLGWKSKTVQDKIQHGTVVLQRALKLARGFERQKFSRRIKTATTEKDEAKLARLEEEKTALQSLDLQLAARKCLRRHIEKEKALREVIDVSAEFGEIENTKQQGEPIAVVNVESRLYGSNPVKEALPPVLGSLRGVLGLATRKDPKAANGNRPNTRQNANSAAVEDDEQSNMSDRTSDEEDSDSIRNKLLPNRKPQKPVQPPSDRPAEATFLPSLTMGGYLSGSDSDDDDPYNIDAPPQLAERKNRRGQRARQAIWEKKYGTKAKHLQGEKTPSKGRKGQGDSRDSGWDMKRGAQDSSTSRRKPGEKPWLANRHKKGDASASGGNATELKPRKKFGAGAAADENKPLHPSWEAAKKAKETKAIPAFSGTKMTFD